MSKIFLIALAVLFLQALACSGGTDFTSSGSHDAAVATDAGDTPSVVANPSESADASEAGMAPPGDIDATAGLPILDASASDAPMTDGAPDAAACSSTSLRCDGGCTPNDVQNCGACGTVCAAPANGMATCTSSGTRYACGASCNANYTKCGGACVDTRSDSNNCGACGHSCAPGKCGSGKCEPWVVTVDDGATSIGEAGLVTDGTNLVWLSSGSIKESPVRGGTPFLLFTQTSQPNQAIYNLAMASSVVAWTIGDANGGIDIETATEGMANSASAGHLVPNSSACTPRGLAVTPNGMTAYFILECASSAEIYSCDLTSFACDPLTPAAAASSGLTGNDVAFANGLLFWTDSANGYVKSYSIASTQIATVSISDDPFRLAVDSTYVYWASIGSNNTFAINRALQTNPQSGGTVVAPLDGTLSAMTTDGTDVYLAALLLPDGGSGEDQLDYVPVGGTSPPVALPIPNPGPDTPFGVAAAAGSVYWLSLDKTTAHVTLYGLRFP